METGHISLSKNQTQSQELTHINAEEKERLEKIREIFGLKPCTELFALRETCFDAILTACEEGSDLLETSKELIIGLQDNCGNSVFMHCLILGDKKKLETIADLNLVPDNESSLGLHIAALKGHDELIPFLANEGFGSYNQTDSHLATPLIRAIENGHEKVIKQLIDAGANISTGYRRKEEGIYFRPLALSVYLGQVNCFETLVNCAKESKKTSMIDFSEEVPSIGNFLHITIFAGQFAMLDHLLTNYHEKMKSLINKLNDQHQTPLMVAATLGDARSLKRLIEANANLETKDDRGRTALHHAAAHNQITIIKMLHQKGADMKADDNASVIPFNLANERTQRIIQNLAAASSMEFNLRINFRDAPPVNYIFGGGGNKAVAYLGVVKALCQLNKLEHCQRVGGTSAGGILAGFLSLGLNYNEINLILQSNIMVRSIFNLKAERDDIKAIEKMLITYKEKFKTITFVALKVILTIFGGYTGISDGIMLRDWMNELIEKYTGIQNCTLGEFATLVNARKINPDTNSLYKHVSVVITDLHNTPHLLAISSEDPQWRDYILADVLIATGAYPILFQILKLRKKIDGIILTTDHECSDGGMLKNLALELFDKRGCFYTGLEGAERNYPLFNRTTLGFNLYNPNETKNNSKKSNIGNIYSMFVRIVSGVYVDNERMNQNLISQNEERTVMISANNIGTTEFSASAKSEKGQQAIQLAEKTTLDFFTKKSSKKNKEKEKIG